MSTESFFTSKGQQAQRPPKYAPCLLHVVVVVVVVVVFDVLMLSLIRVRHVGKLADRAAGLKVKPSDNLQSIHSSHM